MGTGTIAREPTRSHRPNDDSSLQTFREERLPDRPIASQGQQGSESQGVHARSRPRSRPDNRRETLPESFRQGEVEEELGRHHRTRTLRPEGWRSENRGYRRCRLTFRESHKLTKRSADMITEGIS